MQNGYDLDLTYITERVIAMGFPAEGADSYIRNPMKQVQRLLETKHAGHYKVGLTLTAAVLRRFSLAASRSHSPKRCMEQRTRLTTRLKWITAPIFLSTQPYLSLSEAA